MLAEPSQQLDALAPLAPLAAGAPVELPEANPAQEPAPLDRWMAKKVEALGEESPTAKQVVYLVTISRVLPETLLATDLRNVAELSRVEVGDLVRDALDDPSHGAQGGRPRGGSAASAVVKLVVFREQHSSGEPHYHVAVKLARSMRFAPAKATLRARHKLPSHWSCSHTQWYSAVRYGHIPSTHKEEVDLEPHVWTAAGTALDLFAESQEPWQARAWKRRREEHEKAASVSTKGRRMTFTKLDLTALIMEKELKTATAVIAYVQDHGTYAAQDFVHKNQRQLPAFLQDAQDWAAARDEAVKEGESDWTLLCRAADASCPHGASCSYAAAAAQVFERNKETLSLEDLAHSLRQVILCGPSKTTRTPLLVGPTNSGKTTLVLPFDKLFQFQRVFHKPALGSKFALRNISKDKRFLFWDDFHPVRYAQETLPTATLLSLFTGLPFEVQRSQSFHDGNEDFEWKHGAVVTAKETGLWDAYGSVSAEDVEHLRSRFEVFRVTNKVQNLKDTEPCPCHMARWIRDGAAARDARAALQPQPQPQQAVASEVGGFADLAGRAQLPPATAAALLRELQQLGAVHVRELTRADWEGLQAWSLLRPFEQRRLTQAAF